MNELQKPLPILGPQTPEGVAKKIANGSVIGLLRGKAEAGPRALGFRSILASAAKAENLKIVSEDLKGREYYRPVAPMVTEESFDRYFIGPKGKYMQYKVECTKEAQEFLPAIVHRDNSARPQVVSQKDDPWLHRLLKTYGELTGHECLINTSLNGKGKPICNTLEDAQRDFFGKNIELISIAQPAWKNCERYCITSM
jgi:carbamoyltransferase